MSKPRLTSLLLLAGMIFFLLSCVRASSPDLPHSSSQKSNLTAGMVKKHVKSGTTSQTDIISVFGAPNIITRDREGNEVWTYDRQSMATSSEIAAWNAGGNVAAGAGGLAGSAVIGGGIAGGASGGKSSSAGQASSTTFTLMIIFDESDIVKDYRMQATQF